MSTADVAVATEEAWCVELERHGAMAWRKGGDQSARFNRDIFGLFDVLALTAFDTILSQVKATRSVPRPTREWWDVFLSMPHPPNLRCLWVWLTPEGVWQVWMLPPRMTETQRKGIMLPQVWPPVGGK